MFEGFSDARIDVGDGIAIRARVAGDGPPLLLLHGYPQTHACWHPVAPRLVAAGFTVVCADLRGYGDSGKPPSGADHAAYAKRAMAADHGRGDGARSASTASASPATTAAGGWPTGWRSTTPAPSTRAAVLDIVPTARCSSAPTRRSPPRYYHWFFLIQPDAPARAADRRRPRVLSCAEALRRWSAGAGTGFDPAALADYVRCFADPATIHAPARTTAPPPRSTSTRRGRRGRTSARRSSCSGAPAA